MRILSLLPRATEIVYALGLEDNLVGVSHECDYPPEVKTKPMVSTTLRWLAIRTPLASILSLSNGFIFWVICAIRMAIPRRRRAITGAPLPSIQATTRPCCAWEHWN